MENEQVGAVGGLADAGRSNGVVETDRGVNVHGQRWESADGGKGY